MFCLLVVALVESGEYVFDVFFLYADAGVGDGYFDALVVWVVGLLSAGCDGDCPAGRCEFQGV